MKNSFVHSKLTACAAAVLLCCSVMFSNSGVKAQCPGPVLGCPAWTSVTVTTSTDGTPLNGPDSASCTGSSPSGCCVAITFCYLCCNGVLTTYLDYVEPLNSNCTLTADQLIDFADWYAGTWALYQYFGQGGGCDPKQTPCPTSLQMVFDVAECWELNTIVGNNVYTRCSDDYSCACETTCDVCWNPITMKLTYSNYAHTTRGTCDCPPEPLPPATWAANTCYMILCPDARNGHY